MPGVPSPLRLNIDGCIIDKKGLYIYMWEQLVNGVEISYCQVNIFSH